MPFDGTVGLHQPKFAWVTAFNQKFATISRLNSPEARARQRVALAMDAVVVLESVAEMLDGGERWTKGNYRLGRKRCLVGALRDIRCTRKARDAAGDYLREVIAELVGKKISIIEFNDSRHDFADITVAIDGARHRALCEVDG